MEVFKQQQEVRLPKMFSLATNYPSTSNPEGMLTYTEDQPKPMFFIRFINSDK